MDLISSSGGVAAAINVPFSTEFLCLDLDVGPHMLELRIALYCQVFLDPVGQVFLDPTGMTLNKSNMGLSMDQ
jgi:hypothetical protein